MRHRIKLDLHQSLVEDPNVYHIFIVYEDYPGPYSFITVNDYMIDWMPALTYQRAIEYAQSY